MIRIAGYLESRVLFTSGEVNRFFYLVPRIDFLNMCPQTTIMRNLKISLKVKWILGIAVTHLETMFTMPYWSDTWPVSDSQKAVTAGTRRDPFCRYEGDHGTAFAGLAADHLTCWS